MQYGLWPRLGSTVADDGPIGQEASTKKKPLRVYTCAPNGISPRNRRIASLLRRRSVKEIRSLAIPFENGRAHRRRPKESRGEATPPCHGFTRRLSKPRNITRPEALTCITGETAPAASRRTRASPIAWSWLPVRSRPGRTRRDRRHRQAARCRGNARDNPSS